MTTRDILLELFEGKLRPTQAEGILSAVLDSDDAREVEKLLMLTNIEWTAYAHGATLADLAGWRYRGWPVECVRCGAAIALESFGWKVIDINGTSGLRHIRCPQRHD
jgi:hypothetical protein